MDGMVGTCRSDNEQIIFLFLYIHLRGCIDRNVVTCGIVRDCFGPGQCCLFQQCRCFLGRRSGGRDRTGTTDRGGSGGTPYCLGRLFLPGLQSWE